MTIPKKYGNDASGTSGGRAHLLLGTLMLTSVLAYADMQLFALLADRVKTDFALSDTGLGSVQGLAFYLSMALALVPAGVLADKVNRIRLLMGSAALWSTFTLLTGLSTEIWQLFVCRIFVGVAEAPIYPAAYSIIADIYSARRRALAVSMFLAGTLVGASAATAASGTLIGAIDAAVAAHSGGIWETPAWRLTFISAALPGLMLLAALAAAREPVRRGEQAAEGNPVESRSFTRYLRSERTLLARIIGASVLSQVAMFSMFFWLPSTFIRMFDFKTGRAGEWFGLILGIGSLSGVAVGAIMVSLMGRNRGSSAPLIVFRTGVTLTAAAALFLPFAQSPLVLASTAAAFIGTTYISVSTGPTVLLEVTPNRFRGGVISLLTLAVTTATATTPPLVGALSDNVFQGPRGLVLALSAVAIPCTLAAPLLLLHISRSYKRNIL